MCERKWLLTARLHQIIAAHHCYVVALASALASSIISTSHIRNFDSSLISSTNFPRRRLVTLCISSAYGLLAAFKDGRGGNYTPASALGESIHRSSTAT
ncbi:hypothetical protein F5Y10DRAFT_256195 [Nemania abortiva]|nr:hypothetical protein F5Y10DRAFT_256195 [Nemania abortiva]